MLKVGPPAYLALVILDRIFPWICRPGISRGADLFSSHVSLINGMSDCLFYRDCFELILHLFDFLALLDEHLSVEIVSDLDRF